MIDPNTVVEVPIWVLGLLCIPALILFVVMLAIALGLVLTRKDFDGYL